MNKRDRLALALIIWGVYNLAEEQMKAHHEPYESYSKALITYLMLSSSQSYEQAERKGTDIATEFKSVKAELVKEFRKELELLTQSEIQITGSILEQSVKDLGIELNKILGATTDFKIDLDNLSSMIWNKNDVGFKKMIDKLTVAIQDNRPIQSIVLEIQKATGSEEYNAYRLARNETMKHLNDRVLQSYKDIGVQYVQDMVVVDERTSDQCLECVDLIYPIDEAPELPRHVNCRCTLVPYTYDK